MSAPVIPFPAKLTVPEGVAEFVQDTAGSRFTQTVPAETEQRADRGEIIAALVGAVAILAEVNDPIGRAYRLGLVTRIRSILGRERAALGVL